MTLYLIERLPERLAARIAVNPDTGCWEWCGSLRTDGYGQVRWQGEVLRVHRLVFELRSLLRDLTARLPLQGSGAATVADLREQIPAATALPEHRS